MTMKLRSATAALCLLLVSACAPTPGQAPDPSPTGGGTVEATAAPSEAPTPSAQPTPASPSQAAESPTASPSVSPEPSPSSASPSATEPADSGWVVVDAKVTNESEAEAAGLPAAVTRYVRSRLAEPCNVQFNLFAAHPDGYLVGDESGICAGSALFVYGPDGGGDVVELVEFSSVQPCAKFREAGVPSGVPKTTLFPDGLVCNDDGPKSY
jgi:hypothetical protein